MKQRIMYLLACLISLMGCDAQKKYQSVGVDEFESIIADKNVMRLDVRTAEEYAEGHIALAMNIDVKQEDFEKRAASSLSKSKTIAVYCRSGNRSKKACEILTANGYKVVELATGITGWQGAGKAVTKEEVDIFNTPTGMTLFIHCIKHGSLSINLGDSWIYIDPVTDKVAPATDYTTRPKADYILVTHEHGDHLDAKAIDQLSVTATNLVLNPRSSELLGRKENDMVMKNGDEVECIFECIPEIEQEQPGVNVNRLRYDNLRIAAVPAYNTSADKQQFHPKGRDNGYVLTIHGLRIYIAGDTEPIPEMKDIKDIDIAFLPCNLPFTMTPEQVAEAAKTIRPKVLFPYHYGKTDIQQVVRLLEDTGIDVRIRQYQ